MPPKLASPHGRYSNYTVGRCRCPLCSEAARNYEHGRLAQRRRQRAAGTARKRTHRSPWAPLNLSPWTLEEMAANGLEQVQCSLCFCYMIKRATEGGGYLCSRKAACKARQKRLGGYVQQGFTWAEQASVGASRQLQRRKPRRARGQQSQASSGGASCK